MSFLDTIRTTVKNLRDDTDTTIRNAVKTFNIMACIDGGSPGKLATVVGSDAANKELSRYATAFRRRGAQKIRIYTEEAG